eukprot:CAMPEP_0173386264 /NCGR_PEP_ID=MMETSP1356-20130122/8865_1 /TAXON_ID=77927 ORGANISM="Hemiselmis virescens, Strain PCC157" /NCGR_SAMPLE_ID=MMETSP1356 /ASSEMBLY_ACC=CAM_ASM_000847 /LENGTH=124 /DNA_ID=CAMNT_0014342439 /DNA_START=54 /DNA_END=429 /DNA_ORIENTATION=-
MALGDTATSRCLTAQPQPLDRIDLRCGSLDDECAAPPGFAKPVHLGIPEAARLVHGLAARGVKARGNPPPIVVIDDTVHGIGGALVGHPQELLAVGNRELGNDLHELVGGRGEGGQSSTEGAVH